MTEHRAETSTSRACASRTYASIDALRASIWWMCPRSFMNATCAGLGIVDPAEEIAYWKVILGIESGVPAESLTCVPNTPARWKRLFYDFEAAPQRLCSTAAEYRKVLPHDTDVTLPVNISFSDDGLSLTDRGNPSDRCVVADAYVPSGSSATLGCPDASGRYTLDYRRAYYYEIRAEAKARPGHEACFSIGFASSKTTSRMFLQMQAGWRKQTWGLHSDDGNVFAERGHSDEHMCEQFGPGSVVGAGIVTSKQSGVRRLFFTLNGEFLGFVARELPTDGLIFPICGVDCINWNLYFNFGHEPFVFDIASIPDIEDGQCDAIRGVNVENMEVEFAPTYGPVWPWHQPVSRRPAGFHFNHRHFMGSWLTSASDSRCRAQADIYDDDSVEEGSVIDDDFDDNWSDDSDDDDPGEYFIDDDDDDGTFYSDEEDILGTDILEVGHITTPLPDDSDDEMYESATSLDHGGIHEFEVSEYDGHAEYEGQVEFEEHEEYEGHAEFEGHAELEGHVELEGNPEHGANGSGSGE